MLLRLPYQIKALFLDWLAREFPDRAKHVENLLRGMRGGGLYDASYGKRMKGTGEAAKQIGKLFKVFARRYGLAGGREKQPPLSAASFRRPMLDGQMPLFS